MKYRNVHTNEVQEWVSEVRRDGIDDHTVMVSENGERWALLGIGERWTLLGFLETPPFLSCHVPVADKEDDS